MSESELHIPARDDPPRAKKPATKTAVQPLDDKPSNRNRVLTESRTQPLASSRLLSVGSKENADDRNTIVIDASDDDDDSTRLVASKSTVYSSASSNPLKVNGVSTNATSTLKSSLARKRDSFIGVVLAPSPRMLKESTKARGKADERTEMDMDVDGVAVIDQPSRSAATDHDSPVVVSKGKAKVTAAPAKSSKKKEKAVVHSEASDTPMDVDDGGSSGAHDTRDIRNSHQPSTPPRNPPRKLFEDASNPFTTVPPHANSVGPLSAFEVPYGRVPAEVIYALTEEEKEMTVEEWTRRELEIQLDTFREHGLRKIREFKERAAEVRKQIEAL